MKKQLLIALLTFTAISCFATPSNTELSTHLKNAQAAIKNDLQLLSGEEKALQQKFPDYSASAKILNELFEISQSNQQFSKMGKLMFGLLCYKIRPIDTFTFKPIKDAWGNPAGDFFTFFPFDDSEEDKHIFPDLLAELNINFNQDYNTNILMEENEESIRHLMKTLVEKYCHKDDTRTLEEKMENVLGSYESLELSHIVYHTKILTALLQDIENKIKELQ